MQKAAVIAILTKASDCRIAATSGGSAPADSVSRCAAVLLCTALPIAVAAFTIEGPAAPKTPPLGLPTACKQRRSPLQQLRQCRPPPPWRTVPFEP